MKSPKRATSQRQSRIMEKHKHKTNKKGLEEWLLDRVEIQSHPGVGKRTGRVEWSSGVERRR
jgi:hypothetical protein